MSRQDVASRFDREASRRRVKFQACGEDLEGRLLLSWGRYGHQSFYHMAHVQRTPALQPQTSGGATGSQAQTSGGATGSQAQTSSGTTGHDAQSSRHGRRGMGRHGHGGARAIATASPMITVAPAINVQPVIYLSPSV